MNKKGLGIGLTHLLGDISGQEGESLRQVPIEQLRPGRFQPRQYFDEQALEELADSIANSGMLQPLVVRPLKDDSYEIIAGERRWRAAQKANFAEVTVIIREMEDETALELAIVENVQREDLGAVEEAHAYAKLMAEFGHTQATVAGLVGKSRPHVANLLRLLTLPADVLAFVQDGSLSAGHARALIGADDPAGLAREIITKNLSVRQTEALVSAVNKNTPFAANLGKSPKEKSADVREFEEQLSLDIGLSVEVVERSTGGELKIKYASNEQLDAIAAKLRG